MHLFLRIQTLAQILGYRLFSLTYSNICLMARPEDLVLYKVMPTRDIVKCSSINMTNARLYQIASTSCLLSTSSLHYRADGQIELTQAEVLEHSRNARKKKKS